MSLRCSPTRRPTTSRRPYIHEDAERPRAEPVAAGPPAPPRTLAEVGDPGDRSSRRPADAERDRRLRRALDTAQEIRHGRPDEGAGGEARGSGDDDADHDSPRLGRRLSARGRRDEAEPSCRMAALSPGPRDGGRREEGRRGGEEGACQGPAFPHRAEAVSSSRRPCGTASTPSTTCCGSRRPEPGNVGAPTSTQWPPTGSAPSRRPRRKGSSSCSSATSQDSAPAASPTRPTGRACRRRSFSPPPRS